MAVGEAGAGSHTSEQVLPPQLVSSIAASADWSLRGVLQVLS